jgi:hypothetical protein
MGSTRKTREKISGEISAKDFSALIDKFGLAGAVRYLQKHYKGKGDYTKERHKWLDRLSFEEITRQMAAKAGRRKPSRAKKT